MEKVNKVGTAISVAANATTNENLYCTFHGEDSTNNKSVSQTWKMSDWQKFLDVFPETEKVVNDRFNAMQVEAAQHFGKYLCPDFDALDDSVKAQYVELIQQRPKSVLAFSLMSEAYNERGLALQVKSPEDLSSQLNNETVVVAAEHLSFRNMQRDMPELIQKVKDNKVVYRPRGRNAFKSLQSRNVREA